MQAIRSQGVLALSEVEGVVLETGGSFSVVKQIEHSGQSSMMGIGGPARQFDMR